MLDITPLKNAVLRLDEGLKRYFSDVSDIQIRDGLIQRFELTYELSHKMLCAKPAGLGFGSRTTDKFKPYSDLDLAIISDEFLGFDVLADLNNAFSESDLPWKVDVIDWSTISDNFKEIIKQHYVVLQ